MSVTRISQGEFPKPTAAPVAQPERARGTNWEWFFRLVPAFDSLRAYSWRSLRFDSLAGLTVAAVAVPQAMAYATIAGLDPRYGLYTAIVMTAVGALFDSSRQLINGPTNAISIALFSALALVPPGQRLEAAVLMALLVGLAQTGITLLRLGDLTRFISHAVIVGFTLGAAILLVMDQFKNLLGLPAQEGGHFLLRFWQTIEYGSIHPWTATIGLGTIALVLGLAWVNNRFRILLPELLITMIVMAGLVALLGLDERTRGVAVVGYIPGELPTPQWPSIDWELIRNLSSSALAIGLLGLLEAVAMAKAIAARTGQKLDINQQCLSEGLANLSGSFFQCFPGSGSLTRSAINQQAGAVSQWSGVIAAGAVAATVLLFAPLAHYIPRAALAGILMVSAWRLIDRHQLVFHLRITRFDKRIVLATALSAIIVSVEFCILIGVFLSFLLYVKRAAQLFYTELTVTADRVLRERNPEDPPCGRLLICSLEGELFFGSSPDLERHFATMEQRTREGVRIIVLRLKRVRNPDAVCMQLLDDFLRKMASRNVTVLLCGVRRDMDKALRRSGIDARLGKERIFHEIPGRPTTSTLEAVRQAYDLLKGDVCETCPRRGDMGEKEVLYYMI